MHKYRIRYTKEISLKYLSHLDLIRAIERAARRAQLAVAYSEGFHPHPKFSFGPALAVGISSSDEYFDLELTRDWEPESMREALNRSLPEGLRILAVKQIAGNHPVKPLNAVINRASYAIGLRAAPEQLPMVREWLAELLNRTEIMAVKRSKENEKVVNIRPWLHNLSTETGDDNVIVVNVTGEIGSGGHLRPEDIFQLLPYPVEVLYITRLGLWHEEKGKAIKPLDFCEKAGGNE
jgi:radical SAM-linked protein